jgi:AcrR family transcriptional regulator
LTAGDIEQQRRKLCAAALSLYKSKGYEAVSLRNLARRLKISHTLAYRYFDSKDALFARVRTDCFLHLQRWIQSRDPVDERPVVRIHAMARALLDFVRAHPAEYRLMFALHQPPLQRYPDLLKVRRDLFEYIVGAIQDGIDAGEIRGDARTVMHCAWAAAHGALMLHAANQLVHGQTLNDLVEPLLNMMVGPLFAANGRITDIGKAAATGARPRRLAVA